MSDYLANARHMRALTKTDQQLHAEQLEKLLDHLVTYAQKGCTEASFTDELPGIDELGLTNPYQNYNMYLYVTNNLAELRALGYKIEYILPISKETFWSVLFGSDRPGKITISW